MNILGSERVVTQDFATHQYQAEDYAGNHLSDVKITGKAKVISTVNKYISHEDSINYNNFLENKNNWKDGNYYNCISITGKKVRYYQSELGGNEIWLECYQNNEKRYFRIDHLAEVLVNVGDIVDSNIVIGKQGNTGLVLSNKPVTDATYGSHVHFEVRNNNYGYINPRDYATGNIVVDYIDQSNPIDNTKKQIRIVADKINIRESYNINSNNIGDVYAKEIYTVLDEVDDETYIWYKITTNFNVTGYVASLKDGNWVEVINYNPGTVNDEPSNNSENSSTSTADKNPRLIFECKKDGLYAIRLNTGEKLYLI